MNQSNLQNVDWNSLPKPVDDGAASHLAGAEVPNVTLNSTDGGKVCLRNLTGWNVLYFYPMTGRPNSPLPDGWDEIPGARGCTPQTCAFRDQFQELSDAGISNVFGISTQSSEYQKEAADRLHIPFPLLSDSDLELASELNLPTFEVEGNVLIKRITLICTDSVINKVFYPVFPPDKNADEVLEFVKNTKQN